MIGRAAPALAVAALALAGCVAASAPDGPIGTAAEATDAKPIIDYPVALAPLEKVPIFPFGSAIAARPGGYLTAWLDFPPSREIGRVRAVGLGPDGAPLSAPPLTLNGKTEPEGVSSAVCAPDGSCIVAWSDASLTGRISTITGDAVGPSYDLMSGGLKTVVAYDPDSAAFLVAWSGEQGLALHFRDGAPLESAPIPLGPAGDVSGVACAPGHGCLVTFRTVNGAKTSGAIVLSTSSTPLGTIFDGMLTSPTYGDGVYLMVSDDAASVGFVRLDLDGAAIDAAPIPLLDAKASFVIPSGAGFDGTAFTVFAQTYANDTEVTKGLRVLADGSSATPASFELEPPNQALAVACGNGSCGATVSLDADLEFGLSALTVKHGVPGAPHPVVKERVGQQIAAAFSFDEQVLAVWSEGSVVRTRRFASDGHVASAIEDISEAMAVGSGGMSDGAGLIVLQHADGSLSTRVVTRAGIESELSVEPPASTRRTSAAFAWVDPQASGTSIAVHRFDAAGQALDAKPIAIHSGGAATKPEAALARSGDVFVVLDVDNVHGATTLVRISDTGEIIDAIPAPHFHRLACSATTCLLAGSDKSDPKHPRVLLARVSPHADKMHLSTSTLDAGHPALVDFDGEHFLVTYTEGDELRLARLDDDGARIDSRLREGDVPAALALTPDGRALLFSERFAGEVAPADVSVVLVNGFAAPSGASGGDGVVASGGACAIGSSAPDATALDIAVALALALRRRRAKVVAAQA